MMKLTADAFRWTRDSGGGWLCIRCANPDRVLSEIQTGKAYDVEIKQHRERRSLDANAYSWVLTDKLSDAMVIRGVRLSKTEMHAEMIFRYGQPMRDDDGKTVIMSTAQGVPLAEFYPYALEIGEGEVGGKLFKHYRIYRESHTYDSHEFAVFLAGIVEECKEQGIETLTPREIARLEEI